MNLDSIQAAAVDKLKRLKAGALFMKMGTGKTKVALELALSRKQHFDSLLWIAPASLIGDSSYQAEVERWGGDLKSKLHYYSVEGVSQSDRKYLELIELCQSNRVFCILDEALTIKNSEAGRTERLLKLQSFMDFRLILNGTPVTKGLIDFYSQIQFISPKILNMTETQFANNFLIYKQEGFRPWARWSKPENERALIEIIRPYIFDADLDIPVGLESHDYDCVLDDDELGEYDQRKEDMLQDAEAIAKFDFMAIAQKLQAQYTLAKEKLQILKGLLHKADGKRCLIFVKFHQELDLLRDELGRHCLEFSGRQKDDLANFKSGKTPILLVTYGTGSKGLNLQYCNRIVFFSQTFDFSQKEHGLHRCYRTGQEHTVQVHNFWVSTGLERLIRDSLDKKLRLADNVDRLIDAKSVRSL